MKRLLIFLLIGSGALVRSRSSGESVVVTQTIHNSYWLSTTNLSPQAQALIKQITNDRLIIQMSSLPRETNHIDLSHCESFSIHPPETMCDGFAHAIYIDHAARKYWIRRAGGMGGVRQLFGPGKLTE